MARARAQLTSAQADLTKAEIDLQRRQALSGSGAVSGEELTVAKRAYAAAQAAVAQARAAVQQAQAGQQAAQSPCRRHIERPVILRGRILPVGLFPQFDLSDGVVAAPQIAQLCGGVVGRVKQQADRRHDGSAKPKTTAEHPVDPGLLQLVIAVDRPVPGVGGGDMGEGLRLRIGDMDQQVVQTALPTVTKIDLAHGVPLAVTPVLTARRRPAR